MIWAFATLGIWTCSCLVSRRAAVHLGAVAANRWRLAVAMALLFVLALAFGRPLTGPWMWWFVASGVMGLGFGDVAMFAAYRRIGTRLTALLTHCLGVIGAGLLEWLWLGNGLEAAEILLCGVILTGVVIACGREALAEARGGRLSTGLLCGCISACGLACGGVLTRKARLVAEISGVPADGLSGGFLRTCGGFALLLLVWPLLQKLVRLTVGGDDGPAFKPDWRRGWPWLLITGALGPGIGVACYQYALLHGKAGVVHAILAAVPVLVMPLTWRFEGDRPRAAAIVGALIAVGGAACMAVVG